MYSMYGQVGNPTVGAVLEYSRRAVFTRAQGLWTRRRPSGDGWVGVSVASPMREVKAEFGCQKLAEPD